MVHRFLLLGSLLLFAATCPVTEDDCRDCQGATSGNCHPLKYPPLAAFGSLSTYIKPSRGLDVSKLAQLARSLNTLSSESVLHIQEAKSLLTNLLINRVPGTPFFVANHPLRSIEGNTPQVAGYLLLIAAQITEWELKYSRGPLWVQLPVLGADNAKYQICDFIDFLWRDLHNPFHDDPDFPYDRNLEDDSFCWYGMHAFANGMLKTDLSEDQIARYETVKEFSATKVKG
jgi:hypothetical protein